MLRPELLHKKDRGRPTEASDEIEKLDYGKVQAKDYVPGAEVLLTEDADDLDIEINSDSESDDEQWIDVQHSDDENGETLSEEEGDEEDGDGEEEDDEGDNDNDKEVEKQGQGRKVLKAKRTKQEILSNKKSLAQKVTIERLLTDEDFKRIDMANVQKQLHSTTKGQKRKLLEETSKLANKDDLVKLSDIENIYKKRKHDKQTRMEAVKKGQEGREKFGYKDGRVNIHCSKTNREKRKKKNFQMIKHKVQGKVKRSFKDKQIALRNHLVKLKKMK